MNLNPKRRLTSVLAVLAVCCLIAGAIAAPVKKHNHHGGHTKVSKAEFKKDGNHPLEKNGKHAVSVDTKNGKITKFHAKHDTKGEVAVKKYKSHKKMAMLDNDSDPSEGVPTQQVDEGTVWIAYAYVDDDGNEEYYWYEAEEIYDADSGAVDYVPLS
jgi:hypothetical protein